MYKSRISDYLIVLFETQQELGYGPQAKCQKAISLKSLIIIVCSSARLGL